MHHIYIFTTYMIFSTSKNKGCHKHCVYIFWYCILNMILKKIIYIYDLLLQRLMWIHRAWVYAHLWLRLWLTLMWNLFRPWLPLVLMWTCLTSKVPHHLVQQLPPWPTKTTMKLVLPSCKTLLMVSSDIHYIYWIHLL